jgi:DNA-binding NarL/FixJ family response regulator
MLRVLIADDHPLFRDGLHRLVARLGDPVEVVEAGNLPDASHLTAERPDAFDLLLVDLRMPGMNGFEGITLLRKCIPQAPLVVITGFESRRNAEQSLEAGAAGFIPKSAPPDVMLNALKLVLLGEIYMPPSLIYGPTTGRGPERGEPSRTGGDRPSHRVDPALFAPLTQRQIDVLALLGQGKSNKDIAGSLHISEGTVKVHVGAILKILSASNRTQAALLAIDAGIAAHGRMRNDGA